MVAQWVGLYASSCMNSTLFENTSYSAMLNIVKPVPSTKLIPYYSWNCVEFLLILESEGIRVRPDSGISGIYS